jgi:hypothetical protein
MIYNSVSSTGMSDRRKILPKDGKRIGPVRNCGNLAVQELPFRLSYRLFGSLMPARQCTFCKIEKKIKWNQKVSFYVNENSQLLNFIIPTTPTPMQDGACAIVHFTTVINDRQ